MNKNENKNDQRIIQAYPKDNLLSPKELQETQKIKNKISKAYKEYKNKEE